MTDRLYYEDAYLWTFEGKVIAEKEDRGTWVCLDRSAFYPTSGGQPFDTGRLEWTDAGGRACSAEVSDVEADREGQVWHRVDRAVPEGTVVRGTIDGPRRRDHMEQHGGEHMLAGAIWEKLGGTTIGLHLGKEDSSIDVSMPDGRTHLTAEEIEMLEETVNERIRMDAPIRCWFPTEEELRNLPLRKPPTVTGHIRIVTMGDFEMVACGGTHPSSTGRIGQIKVISAIPSKGKVRVTFVCGGRAEKLFRKYMVCANKAGNVLSAPLEKLAGSAGELKARLADAERRLNRFETERILVEIRGNEDQESLPGVTLSVTLTGETDAKPLAEAVSRYIAEDGRALLLCAGERLTFARSGDVDIDMNELIKRVGRGGGRPDLASGAGIPQCAEVAKKILTTEGKGKSWRISNRGIAQKAKRLNLYID
ncbi:MAG: hypothetical protein IKE24_12865 [Clostridia bacterium]|nr:hypothetical protein [Clostridia bacterium]